MKVLFICSGNAFSVISPIIDNQAESLRREGVGVDIFPIIGKGLVGYLKNLPKLRKHIRKNKYDVIHAHYSLSGFIASLACAKPLIVSLMGSDAISSGYLRKLIRLFHRFSWHSCIVKSEDMKVKLGISNVRVIPNGVDTERFRPLPREEGLKVTGWDPSKRHILFGATPDRPEKNFPLFKAAFESLDRPDLEIQTLKEVPNNDMPYFYASADLTILTSLWEGSPNVIKEAMACNCPVVCTDVGDVKWLTKGVDGCLLTSFDPDEIAQKMRMILKFAEEHGRTEGRKRIFELSIDSVRIARNLIRIYKELRDGTN